MAEVPRERFVPRGAAPARLRRRRAPHRRGPDDLAALDRRLHGSGCSSCGATSGARGGHRLGLRGRVSRALREVVTIERHERSRARRATLAELGYDNVEVRNGDGTGRARPRAVRRHLGHRHAAADRPRARAARRRTLVCPTARRAPGALPRRREETVPVRFVPLVAPTDREFSAGGVVVRRRGRPSWPWCCGRRCSPAKGHPAGMKAAVDAVARSGRRPGSRPSRREARRRRYWYCATATGLKIVSFFLFRSGRQRQHARGDEAQWIRSRRRRAARLQGERTWPCALRSAEAASLPRRVRAQLLLARLHRPAQAGPQDGHDPAGRQGKKYRKGEVVMITVGFQHSPRERIFEAVIDSVEVKKVERALAPRHRARQPRVPPARRDGPLPGADLRPQGRARTTT